MSCQHTEAMIMDAKRFDSLTVDVSVSGRTRRGVLTGGVGAALAAGLGAFRMGQTRAAATYPHCCGRLRSQCKKFCRGREQSFVFHECVEGTGGICQTRNCACGVL